MNDVAILYLGAFTPNRPEYLNAATSTAGNLFQLNFLEAFGAADLPAPEVVSYRPMPSFPRSRTLFYRGGTTEIADGEPIRFMPFLNIGALKIVSLGIASFVSVLKWAADNPEAKRKIVIAYNLTAPPAWPILWACRLVGAEFVPFIGDIYVPGEVVKDTWMRRREFESQKRVIPKVDGLMVANRAIVEDFAPNRDSILVEGGVPEAMIDRFACAQQQDRDTFNIVFAGALTELNGIPLLLEVFAKLDDPRFRLTIAGRGECEPLVKQVAARDSRVTALGLIPHEKVAEQYETADLLVSLRRTNNQTHRYVFPSKVVECLSTGRPLLTTATGHAKEEFGPFALIVEDETATAIADQITEFAAKPAEERFSLGKAAQDYVRRERTWEANVVRLRHYLESKTAA